MNGLRPVHVFLFSVARPLETYAVQVNNAGLMENVRTVDEDNLERNFCVNTLGIMYNVVAVATMLHQIIPRCNYPHCYHIFACSR